MTQPTMSLANKGELAVAELMQGHVPLTSLLVGGPKGIKNGPPTGIYELPIGGDQTAAFDEEDLPLVTYTFVTSLAAGHGYGDVTVEVDHFVHQSANSARGGILMLRKIDDVLEALFAGPNGLGRVWDWRGHRVAVKTGWSARSFPGAKPLQMSRSLRLGF